MIQLSLHDGASAALAAMPDRIRDALSSKANALAAELQAKIQQKLSGGVLNQKSGALARSIAATVDDLSADVSVTVATGDIPYATIHELAARSRRTKSSRTKPRRSPSSSPASKPSPRG